MEEPIELSERRAEVTRDAIRRAVADVLEDGHPASVSVADVAQRAGLSVRTIYRYFPNKQALLDDVANIQLRKVQALSGDTGALYRESERWLPELWRTFAEDLPAIRAQQASAAGSDLRDRRLGQNRTAVAAELRGAHPGLDAEELARLVDAIIAVTSSTMFLELHDRMGWDVDEAAELSLWIMQAIRKFAEEEAP